MYRVLGNCGRCGGDVVVPTTWFGTTPPRARCASCGAQAKNNLPTIEMEPPKGLEPYPLDDLGAA